VLVDVDCWVLPAVSTVRSSRGCLVGYACCGQFVANVNRLPCVEYFLLCGKIGNDNSGILKYLEFLKE